MLSDRAFSVRYWLINLGNSLGALVGGALVASAGEGEGALTPAYLVDAATSVGLAATLALLPEDIGPREERNPQEPLRWTRTLIEVAAANALVVVFGMAMFEAVIPFVFVGSREGEVPLAHAIVASSTVAITLGQLPAGRWSERRSKAGVLVVQSALWALAALLGLCAVGASGRALWGLGLGYGVVFGLGECLFAADMQPLVVWMVPPAQLGRFNGVLSASFSAALAVGPALGFALAGHVSSYAFWVAVAVAIILASALWARIARSEGHEGP